MKNRLKYLLVVATSIVFTNCDRKPGAIAADRSVQIVVSAETLTAVDEATKHKVAFLTSANKPLKKLEDIATRGYSFGVFEGKKVTNGISDGLLYMLVSAVRFDKPLSVIHYPPDEYKNAFRDNPDLPLFATYRQYVADLTADGKAVEIRFVAAALGNNPKHASLTLGKSVELSRADGQKFTLQVNRTSTVQSEGRGQWTVENVFTNTSEKPLRISIEEIGYYTPDAKLHYLIGIRDFDAFDVNGKYGPEGEQIVENKTGLIMLNQKHSVTIPPKSKTISPLFWKTMIENGEKIESIEALSK